MWCRNAHMRRAACAAAVGMMLMYGLEVQRGALCWCRQGEKSHDGERTSCAKSLAAALESAAVSSWYVRTCTGGERCTGIGVFRWQEGPLASSLSSQF